LDTNDQKGGLDYLFVSDSRAEVIDGNSDLMRDKDAEAYRDEDEERSDCEAPSVLAKVSVQPISSRRVLHSVSIIEGSPSVKFHKDEKTTEESHAKARSREEEQKTFTPENADFVLLRVFAPSRETLLFSSLIEFPS